MKGFADSVRHGLLLTLKAVVFFALLASAADESGQKSHGGQRKVKSCKGLWRPESLPGKCFGPTNYKHANFVSTELKNKDIDNADDCRKLCCVLEDKCITWQFQEDKKICSVGSVVRFGPEGCDGGKFGDHCGNWCEPNAPIVWNGKRITKKSEGQCEWGESLPAQCFGLGPEKKVDGKPLNADQCAAACCKDAKCDTWQEFPGRGCFFGHSTQCEKPGSTYIGGRKCVKGHCGGQEKDILEPWLAKHAAEGKVPE
jgi:hypothetical protein